MARINDNGLTHFDNEERLDGRIGIDNEPEIVKGKGIRGDGNEIKIRVI